MDIFISALLLQMSQTTVYAHQDFRMTIIRFLLDLITVQ